MLLARREERLEGPTEGFFWLLRARFLDARSPYRWIPRTLGFTASPCSLGLAGALCWCVSSKACVDGIWLVPVVEVLNGLNKWQFGRPRPGWNDPRVDIRSLSHE